MSDKLKAVGRFLCSEFNSVAKVYFAPLVGVCKGRLVSYETEAWARRDEECENNWTVLKHAFK